LSSSAPLAEYDVFYTEGLVARIYVPDVQGGSPGVVEVHGGGWNGLNYRSDEDLNRELARRGIFVASLEFRQGSDGAYPKSIRDVTAGIEWLAAERDRFGLTRIGVLGNSSGGQQAMLAALLPGAPLFTEVPPQTAVRLDFAVLCWPVIDPLARYEWAKNAGNRPELASKHLDYWRDAESMIDGSPQHVVATGRHLHLPPVLVIQGSEDENLPPEMLDTFVRTYREAGGRIKAEIFEGRSHNFVIRDFTSDDAHRAVDIMSDFILTERLTA
jgi:acetyl esterase